MSRLDSAPRSAAARLRQKIALLQHLQRHPDSRPRAVFATCMDAGEIHGAMCSRLAAFCAQGLLARSGQTVQLRYRLTAQGSQWLAQATGCAAPTQPENRPERPACDRPMPRALPRCPDLMSGVYQPPAMPVLRAGALTHTSYRSHGHGC